MERDRALVCGNLFGEHGRTEILIDPTMRAKGNLYRLEGGPVSYLEANSDGLEDALRNWCANITLSAKVRYTDGDGRQRERTVGQAVLLPKVSGEGFLAPVRETWASGDVGVCARAPEPFCGVVRSPIARSNTVTCVPLARAVEATSRTQELVGRTPGDGEAVGGIGVGRESQRAAVPVR